MLHGGEPITRGTRYILAVFAYLDGAPLLPTVQSRTGVSSVGSAGACSHTREHDAEEEKNVAGQRNYEKQNISLDGKGRETEKKVRDKECVGFGGVVWKTHSKGNPETSNTTTENNGMFSFNFN